MKKLFVLLGIIVLLSGCAHWEAMTQEQKNMTVATTVAALVLGVVVSDDGGNGHISQPCLPPHKDCD